MWSKISLAIGLGVPSEEEAEVVRGLGGDVHCSDEPRVWSKTKQKLPIIRLKEVVI